MKALADSAAGRRGQAATEYVLLVVLVTVPAALAVGTLGTAFRQWWRMLAFLLDQPFP